MVAADLMRSESEVNYVAYQKGGRRLAEKRTLFSPDQQSIIILHRNTACVYSLKTTDFVRSLDPEKCTADLVSVAFPDDEPYNLVGCTEKGCVTLWTWETGVIIREKQLELTKPKMRKNLRVLTFTVLRISKCLVAYMVDTKLSIAICCMKTGAIVSNFKNILIKYKGILKEAVGWNNKKQFAAFCNGTSKLFIFQIDEPKTSVILNNSNNVRLLSIAAHPNEHCIATGDALGRIIIWRGNLNDKMKVVKQIMHWHSLPVITLCFSLQGQYLLTGGLENVMVKWPLDSIAHKANEKQFVTRLPGNLKHISTNNTHIAISTSNNSVQIFSAQLQLLGTIMDVGGMCETPLGLGQMYHVPTQSLILEGRTGHLQLFSTVTNKVLYNVDITELNQIPATRLNLWPKEMEVVCAAVSVDGNWLVTSEYRNDGQFLPEECLKFWSESKETSRSPFVLNTCANMSHGGCKVTSISLDRRGEFCVTAGRDQKFRVWKRNNSGNWDCIATCYYSSANVIGYNDPFIWKPRNIADKYDDEGKGIGLNYLYDENLEGDQIIRKLLGIKIEDSENNERDTNHTLHEIDTDIGSTDLSEDGSLISVWFGAKLTLWDTDECNLKSTLSHPLLRPKGVACKFGHGDAAHYLACTTEQCLAVWHLLSLSIKWVVNLQPITLAADPFSNRMVVITAENDVFVFTPHSSTPVLTKRRVLPPSGGLLRHCTFGYQADHIQLLMLRNNFEIFCLERERSQDSHMEVVMQKSNAYSSNFSALVAEQQTNLVKPVAGHNDNDVLDLEDKGNQAILKYLSAASHTMPAISLLSVPFLESLFKDSENKGQSQSTDEQGKLVISSDDETSEESDSEEVKMIKRTEESINKPIVLNDSKDLVLDEEILISSEKVLKKILKEPMNWVKAVFNDKMII